MKKLGLAVLVLSLLFVSPAFAATLAGNITADDAFRLYISTDDNVQGDLILDRPNGFGDAWKTAEHFSTNLSKSGIYYIHVEAWDVRQVIAGTVGSFSLSWGKGTFQNGTQSLLTNTNDWTVRETGWDTSFATITSRGTNATATPWVSLNGGNPIAGIDNNAEWIWTNNGTYSDSPRFFSTKITVTPEPVSMVLFGLGAGVLGLTKLRRKKK